MIDKEGRGVDALVLWFVILRDGAGRGTDVRSDVGAADVEGVGVDAAAVAIRGSGVEHASGVDEAGGVVGVVGTGGTGGADVVAGSAFAVAVGVVFEVAVAVAGVGVGVEGAGIDIAGGVGGASTVDDVAVAAGDGAGAVIAKTRGLRGAGDVRGDGLDTVGVKGVQ